MATATTLHTRRSFPEVQAALRRLPAILAGREPDPTGHVVREIQLLVGVQALSLIWEAFVTKSRGGTDECGIRWPRLSPRTIAYGRRHPGKKKGKLRPSLSESQDRRWRAIYSAMLRKTSDKGHAAAIAWVVLKSQGATTVLEKYGGTSVEILKDTGILYNSLSPGAIDLSGTAGSSGLAGSSGVTGPPGVPGQVFQLIPGSVIVGTNVPYARRHHFGDPSHNLPARQLWPYDGQPWPDRWRKLILTRVLEAIPKIVAAMI